MTCKLIENMQMWCRTSTALNWGIYLCWDTDVPIGELIQAAPCLALKRADDLLEGQLVLLLVNEDEAREVYSNIVGEDGLKGDNTYNGPVKFYACLCNPQGKIVTENT